MHIYTCIWDKKTPCLACVFRFLTWLVIVRRQILLGLDFLHTKCSIIHTDCKLIIGFCKFAYKMQRHSHAKCSIIHTDCKGISGFCKLFSLCTSLYLSLFLSLSLSLYLSPSLYPSLSISPPPLWVGLWVTNYACGSTCMNTSILLCMFPETLISWHNEKRICVCTNVLPCMTMCMCVLIFSIRICTQ